MKKINSLLFGKFIVFFTTNSVKSNANNTISNGKSFLKLKALTAEEIENSRCKQYGYVAWKFKH